MKAVVLAAGEGRRLRPLTRDHGKGMLPVANRPILSYVIESLAGCDIRDITMIVGHQKEKVMNHFGDGREFGVNIEYIHQKFQLGTAHALFQAKDNMESSFLVLPGDSIVDQQGLDELLSIPKGEWGILAAATSNSSKYGVVEVEGKHLKNIREKPKLTEDLISSGAPSIFALALWEYQDPHSSTLINTGTYLLDGDIFNLLEEKGVGEPHALTTCLSEEGGKRKIHVIHTKKWLDAVYPWDILALNEHTLAGISKGTGGVVEEGVVIKGNVSLGPQVNIRANSVLEGPMVIGRGTTIGPGAYIGPNTSIGENSRVGPFSVLRNSIIMDDVRIEAHCSISHSIVAQGSSIGDFFGVEPREYSIRLESYTARKTLGAIIGPDCDLSHHITLNSGVILGSGCKIGAMRNLKDNLPDGTNAV